MTTPDPATLREALAALPGGRIGQLWDEGLVEVVAKAIARHRYPQIPEAYSLDLEEVRAVLAALAQEVGK